MNCCDMKSDKEKKARTSFYESTKNIFKLKGNFNSLTMSFSRVDMLFFIAYCFRNHNIPHHDNVSI